MTSYERAIELEKKLKDMKAVRTQYKHIMEALGNIINPIYDKALDEEVHDAMDLSYTLNETLNQLNSKIMFIQNDVDGAWQAFYAEEYEGEGDEE